MTLTTGAEVVTLTNGFTVTNGTPVLTHVNPNTGQQGQTGESIALTGQFTHWVQGTTTASFGSGDHGGDADHQLGDHRHGQLEHRCGGGGGRAQRDADHGQPKW